MAVSGVVLVASALVLAAAAAALVRRWRLLAALGTALAFVALARAVGMAPGVPVDLADLLLWPGSNLRTSVTVGMDLPLAVGGYSWSLAAVEVPWLRFWLLAGAGAALLSLLSWEERLPALVALALLGGMGVAAASAPASGLWGGVALLAAGAVMLGDRDVALAFLGSGAVGLVAWLLALEEGEATLASGAAVLSLAFWFGCLPWGSWASGACRRGDPIAAGFALAFLPALGWHLLRPAVDRMGPAWLLGGAAWLLGVGGLGALVHRHPREVWYDGALVSLGLVLLAAARAGPGGQEVGRALVWRSMALGVLVPALGTVLGGGAWRTWRAVLLLVGLAALVGLPPWPAFGLWRGVLSSGGEAALPGWVVGVAVGALGASALGWWRVLRSLLRPRQ